MWINAIVADDGNDLGQAAASAYRPFAGLTLLMALCTSPAVSAAPGDLDPTFGVAGRATTDFSGTEDQGGAIALQADGRIVAVGSTLLADQIGAKDFALARFGHDGALDTTFGDGGRVVTHFPSSFFSVATSVQIQSDGRIVVAGYSDSGLVPPGSTDQQFALARYLADGSLDASFGNDGLVLTDFGAFYDFALALTIQPDGKIVAGGTRYEGSSYNDDARFALARYNTDGSLDESFGDNGKVITDAASGTDIAVSIALDSAARIVVGGSFYGTPVGSSSFGFARYAADGTLDTSFGNAGIAINNFNDAGFQLAKMHAFALQVDGKIVAAGRGTPGSGAEEFLVARYTDAGALDTDFGDNGLVDFSIGNADSEAYAVAIDRKGAILVGGESGAFGFATVTGLAFSIDDGAPAASLALARLLPDGSLDAAFGDAGIVTTRFDNDAGLADLARSIQPDASGILVGGLARSDNHAMSTFTSNADFALARYDDGYPIFADGFDPPAVAKTARPHHTARRVHAAAAPPSVIDLPVVACALFCGYRDLLRAAPTKPTHADSASVSPVR